MNATNVFEVTVQYTSIAANSPYGTREAAIRCETGLKPRFVHRAERFSFVIDDVEMSAFDQTAGGYVVNLRAARLAIKNGSRETRVIVRQGKLYQEAETVALVSFKGEHKITENTGSDAVSFLIQYLTTGDETALLVLSDYLVEKLGERMAIANAGVAADLVEAAQMLQAQRDEHERRKQRNATSTYAARRARAARKPRGLLVG